MKKMLLGLIATVFISLGANAQTAKLTKEDVRLQMATTLADAVESFQPFYKKGITKDKFLELVAGTTLPTIPIDGTELLNVTYKYIAAGTTRDEIIKTYSGTEMAKVFYICYNSKDANSALKTVFGTKFTEGSPYAIANKGKFPPKWLVSAFSWIWDHHNEIIQILCLFITVC